MDHDFYIIYNSLLISSGLEQEGRDHPALTTFLLHGYIYKIIDIFQNNFSSNINEILNSKKINETFQFYFKVSRIINFFINLFLFLSFLKLFKLLKIKEEILYPTCIILLISNWFSLSFFAMRSENLSLLFIILSMIFIIKDKEIKIKNYFVAGIFFLLSMLTKIQVIFFIAFLVVFIGTNINNQKLSKDQKLFSKINLDYLFYSLILIIFLYLIFQLQIQEFSRFEKNKYLDLLIFFFSSMFIWMYFFITSKCKSNSIKEKIILFSIILHGFVFGLLIILLIDFLSIAPINNFIYLRITNPIHYLTEFQSMYAGGIVNLKFILETIHTILKSYDQSFIELLLLLSLIFITIKEYLINRKLKILLFFSLLMIFFLITFINGTRSSVYYHLYYTTCYLLVFNISLNSLNKKYYKIFIFSALTIFSFNNYFLKSNFILTKNYPIKEFEKKYVELFERKDLISDICKEFRFNVVSNQYDATLDYLKYWHSKFDDKTINSLCKELDI